MLGQCIRSVELSLDLGCVEESLAWSAASPSFGPAVDKDILRLISGFWGLLRLYTLLLELLEMIWQFSRQLLLWRCILALQLADYMSATKLGLLFTVLLRELLFWECSGKFKRAIGSRSLLLILRLTVDSIGISKVERLPSPPIYTGECTSCSAFIVQDEASISKLVV